MKENKVEDKTTHHNPINDFTEAKSSPLEGFGLFAKKLIPKGTIWWTAAPDDILLIKREKYLALKNSTHSPRIEEFHRSILLYSYYSKVDEALVFCLDNARYVNHSFTPNSINEPEGIRFSSMALRDINPGEEILEDYSSYEDCSWAKIHENFLVDNPAK